MNSCLNFLNTFSIMWNVLNMCNLCKRNGYNSSVGLWYQRSWWLQGGFGAPNFYLDPSSTIIIWGRSVVAVGFKKYIVWGGKAAVRITTVTSIGQVTTRTGPNTVVENRPSLTHGKKGVAFIPYSRRYLDQLDFKISAVCFLQSSAPLSSEFPEDWRT